mgnify:CR=1 FL=1|jgi:NAD(P)-dependent dehydrogenase (short-subunit alcohol dehydrogenase family)|tara:strand:- start:481 stop:1308 length:828 start_codon:yes stop_codon:yes gene_type:complete
MNLKKFNLRNKNALITGAGGLLGFEHAYALLEIGAYVILTDLNMKLLRENKIKLKKHFSDKNFCTIKMDTTKERSILSCYKKLKKKGKHVDILINNAAINPKFKNIKKNNKTRLEHLPLKNWDKEILVGLTGSFLCIKKFGYEMSKNQGGVILNILSDLSIIAPDQRIYAESKFKKNKQPVKPITYSAIKSGLLGITKYLATYWAGNGVRCNALSPGGVFDGQNKKFQGKLSRLIPMGRMANKNEYRSAIQFLCSDASSYMNGHNLVIDGGRTVW